jgi:hypothetical protein
VERNTVITSLLAVGAAFALYLEQPGARPRSAFPGSANPPLSQNANGKMNAVQVPSGCTESLAVLFPLGKRFGSEELAETVRGHCRNVGYSANNVLSVMLDGKPWYVKTEKVSAPGQEDLYQIKWIKNQEDYVASFDR